jgi:hypothetical protein
MLGVFGSREARTDDVRIPTEVTELNRFTDTYNRYIDKLLRNVVDKKQWMAVRRAWQRLAE